MSFLPGVDGMIKALEEKVYLSKKAEEEEAAGFSGGSQVRAHVAIANLALSQGWQKEPHIRVHQHTGIRHPAQEEHPLSARRVSRWMGKRR